MKRLLVLLSLLVPSFAFAQSTQPQESTAAFGQEIMECVGGKVQLRAQVITLQAEVDKLKAELAKPEKPASMEHPAEPAKK